MLSPSGGGTCSAPLAPCLTPARRESAGSRPVRSVPCGRGSGAAGRRGGAAGGGADELGEASRPLLVLLARSRLKPIRLGTHTETLPTSRGHFQTHAAVGV